MPPRPIVASQTLLAATDGRTKISTAREARIVNKSHVRAPLPRPPKTQPNKMIPTAPNASNGVDTNAAILVEIASPYVLLKKSTVHVLKVSRKSVSVKLSDPTIQKRRMTAS